MLLWQVAFTSTSLGDWCGKEKRGGGVGLPRSLRGKGVDL